MEDLTNKIKERMYLHINRKFYTKEYNLVNYFFSDLIDIGQHLYIYRIFALDRIIASKNLRDKK